MDDTTSDPRRPRTRCRDWDPRLGINDAPDAHKSGDKGAAAMALGSLSVPWI